MHVTRREVSNVSRGKVSSVLADVTTPEGRTALLAACPDPDILITNSGGPPAGEFRDLSQEDWLKALNANMLSAIDLIQRTVDGMMDRGFGRIVNVTSHAVKAPAVGLDLSNGARAGLTGAVEGHQEIGIRGALRNDITV